MGVRDMHIGSQTMYFAPATYIIHTTNVSNMLLSKVLPLWGIKLLIGNNFAHLGHGSSGQQMLIGDIEGVNSFFGSWSRFMFTMESRYVLRPEPMRKPIFGPIVFACRVAPPQIISHHFQQKLQRAKSRFAKFNFPCYFSSEWFCIEDKTDIGSNRIYPMQKENAKHVFIDWSGGSVYRCTPFPWVTGKTMRPRPSWNHGTNLQKHSRGHNPFSL